MDKIDYKIELPTPEDIKKAQIERQTEKLKEQLLEEDTETLIFNYCLHKEVLEKLKELGFKIKIENDCCIIFWEYKK